MTILTILRTSTTNIKQPFFSQFFNVRSLERLPSNVMACYDDPNRKCDDDDEIGVAPGKQPDPQDGPTSKPGSGMSPLGHHALPSNVMACYDDPNRKCDDDDEIGVAPNEPQSTPNQGAAVEQGVPSLGFHTLSAHATAFVSQLSRALGLDGLKSSALLPVGI